MNDVLDLLRNADPARYVSGYGDARVARQVALIVRTEADAEADDRRRRSGLRQWGVPTAAFLTVAGAGLATAAAAGWLSPGARHAFDSPSARGVLLELYGASADLEHARERVTAPGPDGSTMSVWTVPVADKGICTVVLVSKRSAEPAVGSSQPSDLPSMCEPVPAPGQVQRSVRFLAHDWRSRTTGTEYEIYSGPLTPAAQVQLRLTNGSRLTAMTRDGYYLLPAVPAADLHCAALVGLDPLGHQEGLPTYLGVRCPGDPYQLDPPAAAPQPGSTITEDQTKEGVGYSTGVEVSVDTVVKQDPTRGLGSSVPGMSLITVRLQFGRSPASQATLPTSVSFDLLYGADHRAATVDPGKHHDPDLSGSWQPTSPNPDAWLPQRSFDVPTDQLATLQVRINGDGTHPTILFRSAPVEN